MTNRLSGSDLGQPTFFRGKCAVWKPVIIGLLTLAAWHANQAPADAQPPVAAGCRNIVLELYVQKADSETAAVTAAFEQFTRKQIGVVPHIRVIDANVENEVRLKAIAKHYGVGTHERTTPLVYGMNRILVGWRSPEDFLLQLRQLLQIEVFVRSGCSRCAEGHAFLDDYARRYPGLAIVYREVSRDAAARDAMNLLVAKHQARAVSVPVFHLCDTLVVGFSGPEITGRRLDAVLARWTTPCVRLSLRDRDLDEYTTARAVAALLSFPRQTITTVAFQEPSEPRGAEPAEQATQDFDLPLPALPDDGPAAEDLPAKPGAASSEDHSTDAQRIKLPLFGELSVERVGLPALTLAIGLVDGFNPCAMWVLLLLLSVLVNLHDRRRILAVAGTFILVSGLAYLAFMAAWLNVFAFIGYLRPIQIVLGITAMAIGGVHIKDFFAFHRGLSLSIPESAKPGIYARTRRIVTAENLWGALVAATGLAVAVNLVELLCTAGLPAIYTEILTQQNLTAAAEYSYLLLYIAAYMFDDALMVGAVVITLEKRKLQQREGRWLKLISGIAIATLGLVMLLRPDWLF